MVRGSGCELSRNFGNRFEIHDWFEPVEDYKPNPKVV